MAISVTSQELDLLPRTNVDAQEKHQEEYEKTYQKYRELLQTLPKGKGWMTDHLIHYQGYWLTPSLALKGILLLQNHFKSRPSDFFLATFPKCGTTWLRALTFATIERTSFEFSTHPLLKINPHDCFPFLDSYIYRNFPIANNLEFLSSPRLFSTHFPYDLLSNSVASSGCKFVYICRDPKDVLVSKWLFMNKLRPRDLPPLSLEEAFGLFCEGVSHYGPYWDHVLGYWKESLASPHKVLFLKYEDLQREPLLHLKRLAEYIGKPFAVEEEEDGVLRSILELCSFDNLSNLEVNKSGVKKFTDKLVVNNCEFFRKGLVGDCETYLTGEMMDRLDRVTKEKFSGWGLNL